MIMAIKYPHGFLQLNGNLYMRKNVSNTDCDDVNVSNLNFLSYSDIPQWIW